MRTIAAIIALCSIATAGPFGDAVGGPFTAASSRGEGDSDEPQRVASPAPAAVSPKVILWKAPFPCPPCDQQEEICKTLPFEVEVKLGHHLNWWPQLHFETSDGMKRVRRKDMVISADDFLSLLDYYNGTVDRSLPAGQQRAPLSEVYRNLAHLNLQPTDTLGGPGCGDARWLIAAVKRYGCDAVGIEVDIDRYDEAVAAVDESGLEDKITLIHGDARNVPWEFNVATCYLYPELLAELKPKLEKLDRFLSYQFQVPNLSMTKRGESYVWTKPQAMRRIRIYDRLPAGSYCQQCGGYCRNPMCHWYTKEVPASQTSPAPRGTSAPARQSFRRRGLFNRLFR